MLILDDITLPLTAWLVPILLLVPMVDPNTSNPNNFYCSAEFVNSDYTGECGVPCPSGYANDCPDGQRCYGYQTKCRTVAVSNFCGASKRDASDRCARECAGGHDGECDEGETCWDIGTACSEAALMKKMAEERQGWPNPFNYFCGTSYADAITQCDTNHFAIPCPPELIASNIEGGCPTGSFCYGNLLCKPKAKLDESEATESEQQSNAGPKLSQPTEPPSVDTNPGKFYCSTEWRTASYDGHCGRPCPGGSDNECPSGESCYGPQPLCTPKEYPRMRGGPRWCGATFGDAKCAKECPGGTDEECDEGEKCFNDSNCQYEDATFEATEGMHWCANSYKHLVENCPKRCDGGTDEECGLDEAGNRMICFDMKDEDRPCSTEGVGIRAPVDPANLWCGTTFLHLQENCLKACPGGTDEECGDDWFQNPMKCFDMSVSDKVCEEEGRGIKARGDPNKRFCGKTYDDMLASCGQRCEDGEFSEGMICFDDTPCVWEGIGVEIEQKDATKLFCGNDWADATECGTPCPSGSSDDCPGEQVCFAEVECNGSSGARIIDNSLDEEGFDLVTKPEPAAVKDVDTPPADASESLNLPPAPAAETKPAPPIENSSNSAFTMLVQTSEPSSFGVNPFQEDVESFDFAMNPESVAENGDQAPLADMLETLKLPLASTVETQLTPPVEVFGTSPPTLPAEASEPSSLGVNALKEDTNNEATRQGLRARNLRMALYGLDGFSSDQLISWELHTADYFEGVYNSLSATIDYTRDVVNNVEAVFDVTEMNLSRNRRRLRSQRSLLQSSAHLLTYTQTLRYFTERDIGIGHVLQYPFSTPTKRDQYVKYLNLVEPELFGKLTSVSPVLLPFNLGSSVSDLYDIDVSSSSEEVSPKFNSFFCYKSGRPCPTGECFSNDLCMFVYDGRQFTPIAPYTDVGVAPQLTPSTSAASTLVELALGGSRPSQLIPNMSTLSPNALVLAKPPEFPSKQHNHKPSNGPTQPTSSAADTASTSGHAPNHRPPFSSTGEHQAPPSDVMSNSLDSDTLHNMYTIGPTLTTGLEMTLGGIVLVRAEHIFEWQLLTAMYCETFYNNKSSPSRDYIGNTVHAVTTLIETLDVSLEVSRASTTFIFKQMTKYDSRDPDISMYAVITQPFMFPDYRDRYVNYLKRFIPETFGGLETVSHIEINRSSLSSTSFTTTLFCGEQWPLNCANTQQCENGKDCPSGQECFTILPTCTAGVDQQQYSSNPRHSSSTQTTQSTSPDVNPFTSRPTSELAHQQQPSSVHQSASYQQPHSDIGSTTVSSDPVVLYNSSPPQLNSQSANLPRPTLSPIQYTPASQPNTQHKQQPSHSFQDQSTNYQQSTHSTLSSATLSQPVLEPSVQQQPTLLGQAAPCSVESKPTNLKIAESMSHQQHPSPVQAPGSAHLPIDEGSNNSSKSGSSSSGIKPVNQPKVSDPILQQQQQQSPTQHPSSGHLSNIDGGGINTYPTPSNVALTPTIQPVSESIYQLVMPSSVKENVPAELTGESDVKCNLCNQGRIRSNTVVNFNGIQIDCVEASDLVTNNLGAKSTSCITVQNSISQSCCIDSQEDTDALTTSNTDGAGDVTENRDPHPAPKIPPNPPGRQQSAGRHPPSGPSSNNSKISSSFEGASSYEAFASPGEGEDGSSGSDGDKGTPDWLFYWATKNSLPPSATMPTSLVIATVASFNLWLS